MDVAKFIAILDKYDELQAGELRSLVLRAFRDGNFYSDEARAMPQDAQLLLWAASHAKYCHSSEFTQYRVHADITAACLAAYLPDVLHALGWGQPCVPMPPSQAFAAALDVYRAIRDEIEKPAQITTDPVVEKNRERLLQRSTTGIQKYKTTLAASGLDGSKLALHLIEELLDGANYAQALLEQLENRKPLAWRYSDGNVHGGWIDHESVEPSIPPHGWHVQYAYA